MRLIVLASVLTLLGSAAHAQPIAVDVATISMSAPGVPRVVTNTLCATDGNDLVCDRGAQLLPNGVISTTGLVVNGVSITGAGGSASPTNVPAFSVHRANVDQAMGTGAWNKIQFNSEEFDTFNNFDSTTNYRFQPTIAGKYLITLNVGCSGPPCYGGIFKNGAATVQFAGGANGGGSGSRLLDMNGTTDYVEGWAYIGGSPLTGAATITQMTGSLLASGNGLISGTTGVGASKLASLTDVSLSNVTGMDILRFNGVRWTNVNVQNAISTTTMRAGWPDAIFCNGYYLYLNSFNVASSGGPAYRITTNTTGDSYIVYDSSGNYSTSGAMAGDCLSKSLSTLYAEGRAFNFIGGSGTGTAIGDRITSGTSAGVVAMAGGTVSFTTGGTSGTAYLDTLGRFIGPGVSTTGAISATSIYAGSALQLASPSVVMACSSSTIGAIRYSGGDFSFCRNGSAWEPLSSLGGAASKLASLTDVVTAGAVSGSVLAFNAATSSWTALPIQQVMSTTTMLPGWPDAIRCSISGGQVRVLYLAASPAGNGVYYYVDPVYDAADIIVGFTGTGAFHSQGAVFGTSDSCYNRSIATLYAEGKAFNFIGTANTSASTALGDRITSGTASGVLAMAGGTISFSTGGTSGTAYLDTLGRFVGAGVSTTGPISATRTYAGSSVKLAGSGDSCATADDLGRMFRNPTTGRLQLCSPR